MDWIYIKIEIKKIRDILDIKDLIGMTFRSWRKLVRII